MTDCIKSLLISCSHLKELFILSNISYFKLSKHLKIEKIFLNMIDDEKLC